jgi:hypothetical protein
MLRRFSILLLLALLAGGAGSASAGSLWVANLSGVQEVPPNGSTATGHANCYLSVDETNLHVKVTLTGFTNVITAQHIHIGAPGVAGPVAFSLNAFVGGVSETDCALLPADVTNLKNGLYYVNVHSNVFPGGEIRGQIGPGLSISYLAQLSGANEVPPNASTKTGVADVTLHADGSIMHLDATAVGFGPGVMTAAHIHSAPPGANGGVVFPITPFTTRTAVDFTPTAAQIADLNAFLYYVNYHTSAFPGGEIRGQLSGNGNSPANVTPVVASGRLQLSAGPNPTREQTTLRFALSAGSTGRIEIFDVAGRTVRLLEARAAAGSVTWDGRDEAGAAVPGGVYYARLVSGRDSDTVRVSVIR